MPTIIIIRTTSSEMDTEEMRQVVISKIEKLIKTISALIICIFFFYGERAPGNNETVYINDAAMLYEHFLGFRYRLQRAQTNEDPYRVKRYYERAMFHTPRLLAGYEQILLKFQNFPRRQ